MRTAGHPVADSHQGGVIHGNIAVLTVLLLAGTALGTALVVPWLFGLAEHASPFPLTLDAGPLAILGACLVALAIHEAGFAAAASVAGFRVEGYRFAGTGGFVLSRSSARIEPVRGLLFLALAGGPAACLVAGFFFLALFLSSVLEGPVAGAGFFGLVCTSSLVMFVASAFPIQIRGVRNVGCALKCLLAGNRTGRQIAASFAVLASAAAGRRPQHWPAQIEDLMAVPHDDVAGFLMGRYLGYLRCLDTGNLDGAHVQLAAMVRFFDGVSREFLPEFACEIAYFQARYRGRPDSAWRWLVQVQGSRRVASVVAARARAAASLAEGNHERAGMEIDRMVRSIQASPMDGFMLFEMSLLDDLRSHYGLDHPQIEGAPPVTDEAFRAAHRLRLVSMGRR